jgi:hypothetical protein
MAKSGSTKKAKKDEATPTDVQILLKEDNIYNAQHLPAEHVMMHGTVPAGLRLTDVEKAIMQDNLEIKEKKK